MGYRGRGGRTSAGGGGGTHGSGTLAARPASPAAGDTYEVTSGVATGDRYTCFVAGAWTLTSFDRSLLLPGTTPWAHWRLDEAGGNFVSVGSQSGMDLTQSGGTVARCVGVAGRPGVHLESVRLGAPTSAPSSSRRCTILTWINPSTLGSTGHVFGYAANPHSPPYATLSVSLSGTRFRMLVGTTAGGATYTSALGATTAIAPAGHDLLLAAVFDGDASNRLTGYVNGGLDYAGNPVAGTDLNWGITGGAWTVCNNFGSEPTGGAYRDAAVYDGVALTAAQIREIYARGSGGYTGQ